MALSWSNPVILNKFQESEGFKSLSKEKRLGALHFAAEHGEPIALRQYLHKISDSLPSVKSQSFEKDEMMTAIHTAASAFRPDLVEVLLSCGFKVDTLDNNGNTPLLAACAASKRHASSASCSRTTMCEKLLNNGADMLAKNRKGATPFLLAQLHEDYSLMTLLLGHTLALSDKERSVRLSRVMEAITSEEADHSLCEAAKDLIGSPIDLKLIQKAAAEEELDLLMTCIAGQFVSMKDLQLIF
jgi:ankyrin repeat protein